MSGPSNSQHAEDIFLVSNSNLDVFFFISPLSLGFPDLDTK
jgi:hypothetical protein